MLSGGEHATPGRKEGRPLRSPLLAAWRFGDGAFRYAKWSGDWRGPECCKFKIHLLSQSLTKVKTVNMRHILFREKYDIRTYLILYSLTL